MSKPEDYQEEEAEPFNVRANVDRPDIIEAHIGDLQAKIERLQALLADITAIAAKG